jgi:hypothetical protein
MKKKQKYYYCKHCKKKFTSYVMADICFDLDMKIIQYENGKNETRLDDFPKR